MPEIPPPLPRALNYASAPDAGEAGPGIGTMVMDFLCGSVLASVLGFIAITSFVLSQPGGMGLEGVVLAALLVGLVVLNVAMAAAVCVGATIKRRTLGRPVTVQPRRLMFYAGLFALPLGVAVAWVSGRALATFMFLSMPTLAALASLPAGLTAWGLARPRA